ncbi:hypothetical protein GCM10027075_76190 [Streptomyces heilongjiangensis]
MRPAGWGARKHGAARCWWSRAAPAVRASGVRPGRGRRCADNACGDRAVTTFLLTGQWPERDVSFREA